MRDPRAENLMKPLNVVNILFIKRNKYMTSKRNKTVAQLWVQMGLLGVFLDIPNGNCKRCLEYPTVCGLREDIKSELSLAGH
jgi:hypothetical protein